MSQTSRKIGIYGTNFITPSIINLLKRFIEFPGILNRTLNKVANAANPYGAVFFGALDLAGGLTDKIKNSKFTRLSHFTGAAFYGLSSISDAISIAGGEYNAFYNLAFDASMAYQLGRDAADDYGSRSLKRDFKEIIDDAGGLIDKLKKK